MGSEWTECTIGDVCQLGDGAHAKVKRLEHGVPYLTSKNIGKGTLKDDDASFISEFDYDRLFPEKSKAVTRLQPGDILTGIIGTFGNLYQYKKSDNFGISSAVAILRPDQEVLFPKYLYYYLSSSYFRYIHEAYASGSAQGYTNLPTIRKLPAIVPPLPEQKEIAHILGTLDDKIELNRRMNATLEGMAQALFKSWFVDFDPVIDNALAAGNPIPDELAPRAEVRKNALANATTQQGSLDHPTLSDPKFLFPAAFQFTEELGWIPEGWNTGKITDLADLNSESWSNKTHPDHVNYVDLANTKNGRINEVSPYDYSEAPSRARRVLKVDDTIIGTVRPGNRSFAYIHEDGLTGSTGFAVLRPKQEACRAYVYLCLTQDDVIDHFAHLADGGAYPAIRPEVVGNLETVTLPQELMELFDQKCYPLLEKIGQHQRATETLTRLRDTLLPKLISGELRLPEAEQLTEKALA